MQSSLRHRLLLKANFQKLRDIFKMYDSGTRPSRSTGSRHAQKHQTYDLTTHCDLEKGCSVSAEAASAPSAERSRARALLILQGGLLGSPPQASFTPGLLPEADRGVHLDASTRRRAGFPLLSVRHAITLNLLHWLRRAAALQTPERSGDAVIRCCLRRL